MSPERWEQIKGLIKDQFDLLSERREPLSSGDPGEAEIMEFVSPAGKIRLEWTDQPLRVSSRALGSKRIGGDTTVIDEYSETERVHRFSAARWDAASSSWVTLRGADDLPPLGGKN